MGRRDHRGRRFAPGLAALLAVLTAGCAVGPDFRRPGNPAVSSYTAGALPPATAGAPVPGGEAQRFLTRDDVPREWWALFRSDPLDRLVRKALSDSPTLAAARGKLREAEENRRARVGGLFPQVDAAGSVQRQKLSGAAFGQPSGEIPAFTLYDASVSVSYALDLFGGTRREIEALASQVDYERYQLEGAWLTLAANVVTTAVEEAALRGQIAATRDIIATEERQLALVRERLELGGGSRTDVLAQEAQLAQTRTALPPLEGRLAQARHRLALLAGAFPAEAGTLPEFDLDALTLPQELPVSVPSTLARRRPDIRAAEALLHAATARIGVATANLYPQVTLSARLGSEAVRAGDLFGAGSSVWGLGAGLLQPLFRGGELVARRRAAAAVADQALAQYRQTVLQAFGNVADALRALEKDADTLAAQAGAEAAAQASLELARQQYELGAASYLALLNAQRQHELARVALVQARAARFSDTAALFHALGGGWWSPPS